MTDPIGRPAASESIPYFERYISRVPDGNILTLLEEQAGSTAAFFNSLTPEQAEHRYAPDKWSIKQVIGHMTDTERIFAYRALRFARADATPLPSYEPDDFMVHAPFDHQSLSDLVREWELVRQANLCLFHPLDAAGWNRRGIASGGAMSVRALAYTIAGHVIHHLDILRTKYL